MAEGGGAVRVPFGRGAGGAVCAESWRSGSEVGDVGSEVFGVKKKKKKKKLGSEGMWRVGSDEL